MFSKCESASHLLGRLPARLLNSLLCMSAGGCQVLFAEVHFGPSQIASRLTDTSMPASVQHKPEFSIGIITVSVTAIIIQD